MVDIEDEVESTHHVRIQLRAKNHQLISARERRRLTQGQMAALIGVNKQIYGRAERLQFIGLPTMQKIAQFLETTVEELFPEWIEEYGAAFNKGKKYIILEDEMAARLVATQGEIPKALLAESLHTEIEDLMRAGLSKREAEVLRMAFGIGREEPLSLQDIGDRFQLGRERIRQIKEKAIRRLRYAKNSDRLRPYLGQEPLGE